MGKSLRIDLHLTRPPHSSIRLHGEKLDCPILADDFSIIACANNILELRIIESLHVLKLKPNSNEKISAFPLKLS